MNLAMFKKFLQGDLKFQKWLKKMGVFILLLLIFVLFSSAYRSRQDESLNLAKEKVQEMEAVIDENTNLNAEYNKAIADGSALLKKKDLNLFQEFILERLQSKQLSIQELKYLEGDKKNEAKKNEVSNEYEYAISFTGAYGNVLEFIDILLDAEFHGKARMLNLQKITLESAKNNTVNAGVVYKVFTE